MRIMCHTVVLLGATATFPAMAQPAVPQVSPSTTTVEPLQDGAGGTSSTEFRAANERMMQGMAAPMSGDADRDFVAGMLPHHQGAVDMAKVELRYGKDPALRRLATSIVKAQESEIAEMRAWQAKQSRPH